MKRFLLFLLTFVAFSQLGLSQSTEAITISSACQLTYCSSNNLDFSGIDALKVYIAKGVETGSEKNKLIFERVTDIPAGTGFLLIGESGTYDIPVSGASSAEYKENLLIGVLESTTINETDGDYTNYYLSNGSAGVGFYKVNTSVMIKDHRAYLHVPNSLTPFELEYSDSSTSTEGEGNQNEGNGKGTEGSEGKPISSSDEIIDDSSNGIVNIKISSARQLTYCSSNNLDFSSFKNLKAYIIKGQETGGEKNKLNFERVTDVPAGTGFLLIGESGTYDIPVTTTSSSEYKENLLVGVLTPTEIFQKDGDHTNYYLSNGANGVGFYKVEASVKLSDHRAYLHVPNSLTPFELEYSDSSTSTEGEGNQNEGNGKGTEGSEGKPISSSDEIIDDSSNGIVNIKISSARQLTYCSSNNLDFSSFKNLKAYIIKGQETGGEKNKLNFERVTDVPAGTGFLLIGESGTYDIPVTTTSSSEYKENLLVGVLTPTEIFQKDGDYTNYYLSNGANGVGFYKVEASVKLSDHRAYLHVPNSLTPFELEYSDSSTSTEGEGNQNEETGSGEQESDTGTSVAVSISAAGQLAYCSDSNLDFSSVPALKAYIIKYDRESNTLMGVRVTDVPARTGIHILGPSGEYSIPVVESSSADYKDNLLVGTLESTTILPTDGDHTNYYLSNGSSGVGFYKVTKEDGVMLGANRCYLSLPSDISFTGIVYEEGSESNEEGDENNNSVAVGGIYYVLDAENKTAEVTFNSKKYTGDIIIPESIVYEDAEYSVKSIGNLAFNGCTALTTVSIPNSVITIGENAFFDCRNLVSVSLGNNVEKIGKNAFYHCAFEKIDIPASVKEICEYAFDRENYFRESNSEEGGGATTDAAGGESLTRSDIDFPRLKEVYIYDVAAWCNIIFRSPTANPLYHADNLFVDGEESSDLTIPSGVSSICNYAFSHFNGLKSVVFSNSVTSVGDYAFNDCRSLTSVSLGNRLETIGMYAFNYCAFEKIDIPASVKMIGNDAFNRGYNSGGSTNEAGGGESLTRSGSEIPMLKEVYIHNVTAWCAISFRSPMSNPLYCAEKLYVNGIETTDLEIPEGTPLISSYAFSFFQGLKSIVIPSSVKNIGDNAFSNCKELVSVSMGNGVETIGANAFSYCSFEMIDIPASVKMIGFDAFGRGIYFDETEHDNHGHGTHDEGGGEFLTRGDTEIPLLSEVHIRDIAAWCAISFSSPTSNPLHQGGKLFVNGEETVEVDIPESVTSIGSYSFIGYIGLRSVNLHDKIASIGKGAFRGTGLISVVIPGSVAWIENWAFDCSHLTSVNVGNAKPLAIEKNVFTNRANAVLSVPSGAKSDYEAADYWKEFSEIIETVVTEDVVYVPNEEEKTLTVETSDATIVVEIKATVVINDVEYTVTAIGEGAFENNTKVEIVSIPETIEFIGNNAFAGCINLKEIRVSAGEPIRLGSASAGTRGEDASSVFAGVDTETCTLYVPYGSKEKYEQAEGWSDFKNIVEMDGPESITISSAKQVTYMSDKDLDFTGYPDLKAYVATGYDKASGTIWLTRVKEVPANTGFLLMGEADTYEIPVKAGGLSSYYQNMFKGTLEATTIYTTDGNYTNYYLSNGESGVGFYKVTKPEGQSIGANRAYLPLPTEIPVIGSEGSTEMIKVSSAGQVPYYNTESLDFSSLDAQGVKAYTATGYDYNSGTIWLTRVKQVPAKTGILIMAPEGEYPVPTASVASVYANMFRGTLEGTTIQTHEEIDGKDYINYYLSSGASGVGFYRVTKEEGVTIGTNRCYLPILNKDAAAGTRSTNSDQNQIAFEESDEVIGIQLLRGIGGDDDGTTSIKDLTPALSEGEGAWYTLQGQRIAKPGKGFYIRNGKMVIVR